MPRVKKPRSQLPADINTCLWKLLTYKPVRCLKGEDLLSQQVADFLRGMVLDGKLKATFTHVHNEGKRSCLSGAIAKAKGMISGAHDFVFVWEGGGGWIELKTTDKSSQLTDNQMLFQRWCLHTHVRHDVCRSVDDVARTLKVWGVLA